MAPSRHARRQREIRVSPVRPSSAEASASSTAPAPPRSDSKNRPGDKPESGSAGCQPGPPDPGPEGQERYVIESGERIPVLRVYDPDFYDPEEPLPWTPEPEPYDPETYPAWGRRRFREQWYQRQCVMPQERNFHLDPPDPIYQERRRALRRLEHEVEGRPLFAEGLRGEEWKRLWARLSKDLPPPEPESPLRFASAESIPSGYSTY